MGPKVFQVCLVINGVVGPLLLGGAVATFFTGSNFLIDHTSLLDSLQPVISRWANASCGLDALLNPWNLIFGAAVFVLARILGVLYIINNVDDADIRLRARRLLRVETAIFLVLFLTFFVYLLVKDGYAYDPATGVIVMEPLKYLHNFLDQWYLAVLLLVGVVLLLFGIGKTVFAQGFVYGIWPAGAGVVLVVLALLLCAGWNDTAYYPSTADLQSSLTIANSCSSEFTLRTMSVVSLLVPFVLAYIVYAWRAIDKRKITHDEIGSGEAY